MLQAPTSETKKASTQSQVQPTPAPAQERHPWVASVAGPHASVYGPTLMRSSSPSTAGKRNVQTAYGNQATLRLLNSPQQSARMTPLRPSQGVMLQRKCACGGSSESEGECAECKARSEETLWRSAVNPAAPATVPPIVHDVLNSPGQPLEASTRAFMEPRFGHDFSQVRMHTDAKAAESARAVNALAYTVGSNVVFGAGQYTPGTNEGRRLMAHELTHVVQQEQTPANTIAPSSLSISDPSDASEHAADGMADSVVGSGSDINVDAISRPFSPSSPMLARQYDVVNCGPTGRCSYPVVTCAVQYDYQHELNSNSEIEYKILGAPDPGYVDILDRGGPAIYEVKTANEFATKPGKVREQLGGYLDAGTKYCGGGQWQPGLNYPLFTNPRHIRPEYADGHHLAAGLVLPGIIAYYDEMDPKGVQDLFVCGTSDQGLIDKFLDNVLDRAQGVVDNYINQAIDAVVTKAINTLSIRQAVNLLYKYAREELLKEMGVIGKLPKGLADEIIVDMIAHAIEAQLKGATEQALRNIVMTIKNRILDNLRKRLKAQLRTFLQESLTALCALAAEGLVTVTAAELLKKLRENMPKYLVPALIAAIEEVIGEILIELTKEVATVLLYVLGAVAAVALIILLLPEEGIAGIIAGIVRLALALIKWLPTLLPELPPIFQFALNDQSQNGDGDAAIADEDSMQEEDTLPSSDSGTASSSEDTTTEEALA